MKKLFGKRAFTLIEVILSIAIFAAIALPMFSLFVQSIKTDGLARDVLNANYISQDYLEKLDSLTYEQALSSVPSREQTGDYYLSAEITPYGTMESVLGSPCDYAHMVMYEDGSLLAVLPDGQWRKFESIPDYFSIVVSGSSYTFVCGYTTLTGSCPKGKCALLINAMNKPGAITSVSAGSNCMVIVYCQKNHMLDVTVTGCIPVFFEGMNSGETSLVHIETFIYDSPESSDYIAESESYVNIKN